MNKNFKSVKGETFNNLMVLEEHIRKNKNKASGYHLVLYCQCKCGRKKELNRTHVLSGHTKSCGCIKRTRGKGSACSNSLPEGEAAVRAVYRFNKYRAKRSGLSWNLNIEQARKIFDGNCTYCGAEPSNYCSPESIRSHGKIGYLYSGIDRVDNNKGYEPANCTSCCIRCNQAKRNLEKLDFLQWANNIAKLHPM